MGSAAGTGKPTDLEAERTSRPDEAGSRENLRNEGIKGASGDEGKGNVAAGKSLLGEAEQGRILRTGLRPKRRPERTRPPPSTEAPCALPTPGEMLVGDLE